MNGKTSTLLTIAFFFLLAAPLSAQNQAAPQAPAVPVELTVPAGFQASVFASGIAGARLMTVAPDGTIYVAKQRPGEVVALPDKNKDGKADETIVIAKGLTHPHSLAFRKGYLYIATNAAILRMKYANGKVEGTPESFIELPANKTGHVTRTMAWGKDNRLYVSIGSSCNVCEEEDARRTTILAYNEDGSGGQPFAKGLRNAIGIDFDPKTGKLWAGDMGQDGLGAEKPGDEINLIEAGKHYGFPYFVGNNEPNAGLKDAKGAMKPEQCTPPAFQLDAHSSPIDLRFYTGKQFPASYRGALFLVLHGSNNNRPQKIGYKVVRVVMKDGKATGVEDFAMGWLKGNEFNGRPAGLITGADGALYISDDNKGFIYRVTYGKK